MPKENEIWNSSHESFVLFMDIMGFKDTVFRSDHSVLETRLFSFTDAWTRMHAPLLKGDHIRYTQFSDSIVVVSDNADDKSFNLITKSAIVIMKNALAYGFPIKGAIAKGTITYSRDKQLFFGQPIIDAYLLEEEVKYYGVVLHHTAEPFASKRKEYVSVPTPFKHGTITHCNLKWNKIDSGLKLSPGKTCTPEMGYLDRIALGVSMDPRIYIDNTKNMIEKVLV